ncbi:hypothetical protein [Rhodovulum steppense]|uniref:Uncharacterized protein n=1 Tax=Rhodovulum steppense TaxID=540251 RepID=A0A4R1YZ48_9RHOB|nr:hypothetical protein [Rhodovulum steppense]TCM86571.1 hypothetical protein EV216_104125 [Rhodovulum steppense]
MTDRPAGRRPIPSDPAVQGATERPMMLELVLLQMQARGRDPARADEIGQLGFMQWLGGLPGGCDYAAAARAALLRLDAGVPDSPTLASFRGLLAASLAMPPRPLGLSLPVPRRRGGARARRQPS